MQLALRAAVVTLLSAGAAHAQFSLSGRVVDEDGVPLARARV